MNRLPADNSHVMSQSSSIMFAKKTMDDINFVVLWSLYFGFKGSTFFIVHFLLGPCVVLWFLVSFLVCWLVLLYFYCCGSLCSVSFPHGAMDWSVVCERGTSWSYSPTHISIAFFCMRYMQTVQIQIKAELHLSCSILELSSYQYSQCFAFIRPLWLHCLLTEYSIKILKKNKQKNLTPIKLEIDCSNRY